MKSLTNHVTRYRKNLLPDIASHFCATLSTMVHDDTPRDTGDAQNSWTPAINMFDGSARGGDFVRVAGRLNMGDYYTLTSRLAYIRRLEYGWSRMAPAGMLRKNVARANEIAANSVRHARAI